MAEPKTKKSDASVDEFLSSIEDEAKRADCHALVALMSEATGAPAAMWGKAIVGFGKYQFKYASGREGEWFLVGFSPRKQNVTLYIMPGFSGYGDLLGELGKHKTGKSCLYVKRLSDVDNGVLRELVFASVADLRAKHSGT